MIEFKVSNPKEEDLKPYKIVLVIRDKLKKEVRFIASNRKTDKLIAKFIGLNLRKAEYEKVILNYFGITKKVD